MVKETGQSAFLTDSKCVQGTNSLVISPESVGLRYRYSNTGPSSYANSPRTRVKLIGT